MVCRVLRILTLIYCHIEVEVIVKSRPYFAHIGWIVFIHFPCEQGQFLNKKTGYNTCLENKLILISIKFTPKTSHSCPKNWYFPRVSRCQPNKNVSTKDQTKKTSAIALLLPAKMSSSGTKATFSWWIWTSVSQTLVGIYRFCNGLLAACYPPVNEDGNEISPCSERKRTFKWSIFHCHFSLQEGSIFIPTRKQGP